MSTASYAVPFQPLHQVSHLGGDRWRAEGDDPQLLLSWPDGLEAGPYRITIGLEAARASAVPQVYLDRGDGWSEATRVDFESAPCGRRWSLDVWLPAAPRPARLDPTSIAGEFGFDGVLLERLGEAEALLRSLVRSVAAEPAQAATLVDRAAREVAAHGTEAGIAVLGLPGATPPDVHGPPAYADWVRRHDTVAPGLTLAMRELVDRLPRRPVVGLVLPAGDVPERALRECIESVIAQVYPDWTLAIVVDPLHRRDLGGALAAFAAGHSRIRVVERTTATPGVGALAATVDALDSDFVALLEDAPVLAPHALLACACAVARRPDAGIVYGDSDRLDDTGRRIDPDFKPDWSPDLFLAQDYLGPLVLIAIDAVRDAGGLSEARAGAMVADLRLRCARAFDATSILHLPAILSHERHGAVAADPEGRRWAVQDHLGHPAPGVTVASVPAGLDVRWPLPRPAPKVSLIVPTRDRLALLRRCVDSICALTTYPDFDLVVVDNRSSESATLEYLDALSSRENVRVVRYDAEFNYSAINNFAVEQVDGEIIGLVNNDIEVITADWLERMVQHAVRADIGAVGAMLYYPDDSIQHAGVTIGVGGVAGHPYSRAPRGEPGLRGRAQLAQEQSAVTGACLLVRRETYRAVGGLDEALAVAFNDVDFCLRLRERGYRNLWTPHAELYHHESASRGAEDSPEKLARFHGEVALMWERWGARLESDPAYNPNLSLAHGEPHALAAFPRFSIWSWMQEQAW